MTTGPTVRRRRLGTELRKLRESNGYKLEEVAAQLGVAPSTLSRIETGKAPTKSAYLSQMLEKYGVVDPAQRQVLIDMAREGHRKGWWAAYDDVLPSGFDIYVGLEAETAAVRGYEVSVVHGLLQTPDYARAVLGEMFPRHGAEQIDRMVALRMERQRRFDDDPPLELWAILDEAVIRRPVGGHAVMRAQLEHLLGMAARPGLTLQVLPFSCGAHAGHAGRVLHPRVPEPVRFRGRLRGVRGRNHLPGEGQGSAGPGGGLRPAAGRGAGAGRVPRPDRTGSKRAFTGPWRQG